MKKAKKRKTKRTDPILKLMAENRIIREFAGYNLDDRNKLLGMAKDHVYSSSANNSQMVDAIDILDNAEAALSRESFDQLTALKTIAAVLATVTGIKFGGQA
jgi:hypothetical protein